MPDTSAAMMDLWFSTAPVIDDERTQGLCRIGTLGDGLRSVECETDLAAAAEAWLFGAGLAVHFPLLLAAATTGRPLLVTINGLGDKALAALRERVGGQLVLTLDARMLEPVPLLEQLAWLRHQPEPFAVVVGAEAAATLAATVGARALVVAEAEPGFDLATVLRVLSAARPGAPRPLSPGEVDSVEDRQTCLTVTRRYAPGEVLAEADLTVAVSDCRGLSPMLARRVAGLRLRYAVAPGEPLSFGHFEDPAP